MDTALTDTVAELRVEPSDKLSTDTQQWTAGNLSLAGSLRGNSYGQLVVHYLTRSSDLSNDISAGFNVWLGPAVAAPHTSPRTWTFSAAIRATLMADCLSCADLSKHPEHTENY